MRYPLNGETQYFREDSGRALVRSVSKWLDGMAIHGVVMTSIVAYQTSESDYVALVFTQEK